MCPDTGTGEKTEKATPKKREDARKKGQVLKSQEINTAFMVLGIFGVIFATAAQIISGMRQLLERYLGLLVQEHHRDMDALVATELFRDIIMELLMILWPILLTAAAVAIVVNVGQVGFMFTSEGLKPQFSKINPASGLKRIFSLRSLVELLKAVLKVTIVGIVVYTEYMGNLSAFPNLVSLSIEAAGAAIFDMTVSIVFKAGLALVALGFADFFYQWYDYEKNLKMTKQEVKDEYKQIEGDPKVKGEIKKKQREISMRRMMQDLPKADVVITNPTHYAIAIQYVDKEMAAPVVLAKGRDYVARKIKEKARELNIEIVENKPVAQALYWSADIGEAIPPGLFAAVAEILAFVYHKNNRAG